MQQRLFSQASQCVSPHLEDEPSTQQQREAANMCVFHVGEDGVWGFAGDDSKALAGDGAEAWPASAGVSARDWRDVIWHPGRAKGRLQSR